MAGKPDIRGQTISDALVALNQIRQQALSGAGLYAPASHHDQQLAALMRQQALAGAGLDPSTTPDTSRLAAELRFALALRGWVNPRDLLPSDLDETTRTKVLDLVAPDAETSFAQHPGKWYMTVPVRRRVIAARDREAIRSELDRIRYEADESDPVRNAFHALLAEHPIALKGRSVEDLRAIENVAEWLGETYSEVAVVQAEAAAVAATRRRAAEVARLTAFKLIGRDAVVATLAGFLLEPRDVLQRGLSVIYLSGVGGSGKSTVLAHVEKQIVENPLGPILISLDFDRVDLDPSDPVSLDLVLLEQLSVALSHAAANCRAKAQQLTDFRATLRADQSDARSRRHPGSRESGRRRKVTKSQAKEHSLALESADVRQSSERDSIMFQALTGVPVGSGSIDLQGRPLGLILDTLETVFARGEAVVADLAHWLRSLFEIAGALGVRIILAGRDPLSEEGRGDIYALLAQGHHRLETPIHLTDLDEDEAVALLIDAGVDDETVARAAATALPGNPLVLRIAAEVFAKEPAYLDEVRTAHAQGRIDPVTASRYLAHRVVAHLPDPAAQPYALAAIVLPEVSEPAIREIVVPVVDEELGIASPSMRAGRVYDALSQASWLVNLAYDGRSFRYHPALRALLLKLIDADPKQAALRDKVRTAAITWHRQRGKPQDRAFVLYHRLMRGDSAVGADAPELAPLIARFVEDLPEAARKLLAEQGTDTAAAIVGTSREPDEEWKAYVEGIGERDGQGDKLANRGRAAEALALYGERPTRVDGVPPTFVIQALADNAEWDSEEVDRDRILREIEAAMPARRKRVSGELLSRMYWLTRYELLRRPGPLEPSHLQLLRKVADRVSPSGRFVVMPALMAAAEALAKQRIVPESWIRTRGAIESETRLHLVHRLHFAAHFVTKPHVDALVVTQKDWASRISSSVLPDALRGIDLFAVQRRLDAMHGQPFPEISRTMRELRRPLELTVSAETSREAMVLLLRGTTIEFHRPLKNALAACYLEGGKREQKGARFTPVWTMIETTLRAMTIQPRDFESSILRELVAADPDEWFGAFVSYADRSRLLPGFCQRIARAGAATPPRRRLSRVAKAFLVWDRALCRKTSSGW